MSDPAPTLAVSPRVWAACEALARLLARERGITVTPHDIAALALERGVEKLLQGKDPK